MSESTSLRVYVATPTFWWRAKGSALRTWVPADPDAERGAPRWADRDEQRWDRIASVVASVSDAMAGGEWVGDPDEPDDNYGSITVEVAGLLTPTERKIVASWFSQAQAVQVDPWFHPITNGRHRLWSTLPHLGDALVPIRGDALGYANPVDALELGQAWLASEFTRYVGQAQAVPWLDREDPLNARFLRSMATAAAGELPSPV